FFTKNPLGELVNSLINVINDPKGVIVAQVFIGFPLATSYFIAVFSSIPLIYEEVALVSGLDRLRYLYKVLIPMTRKQIFLGFVLVFTRVFADFGASLILGGGIKGKTWTFPIVIYTLTQYGEITVLATSISIYFGVAFMIYFLLFGVEH
ncbi:MAG: ABC transporter permease subunit, partial [Desulfurococcaceae archaeon]